MWQLGKVHEFQIGWINLNYVNNGYLCVVYDTVAISMNNLIQWDLILTFEPWKVDNFIRNFLNLWSGWTLMS